jgi:hypothetical protein
LLTVSGAGAKIAVSRFHFRRCFLACFVPLVSPRFRNASIHRPSSSYPAAQENANDQAQKYIVQVQVANQQAAAGINFRKPTLRVPLLDALLSGKHGLDCSSKKPPALSWVGERKASNPNIYNNCGQTPLHVAAASMYAQAAHVLLSPDIENRADPYCPDHSGLTPIHIVCGLGMSSADLLNQTDPKKQRNAYGPTYRPATRPVVPFDLTVSSEMMTLMVNGGGGTRGAARTGTPRQVPS